MSDKNKTTKSELPKLSEQPSGEKKRGIFLFLSCLGFLLLAVAIFWGNSIASTKGKQTDYETPIVKAIKESIKENALLTQSQADEYQPVKTNLSSESLPPTVEPNSQPTASVNERQFTEIENRFALLESEMLNQMDNAFHQSETNKKFKAALDTFKRYEAKINLLEKKIIVLNQTKISKKKKTTKSITKKEAQPALPPFSLTVVDAWDETPIVFINDKTTNEAIRLFPSFSYKGWKYLDADVEQQEASFKHTKSKNISRLKAVL